MIPGLGGGLSVASTDASATAVNPVAGYISGGFSFGPQNSFGGKGTAQSSSPTLRTELSQPSGAAPAGAENQTFVMAGIGAVIILAILLKS